jgi:hypothetical protein
MGDLAYLVGLIRKSQQKELDATLCLSGFVGEGKSTLSIQIAKAYYKLDTQEKFKDFCDKWLIYDRQSLKEAVEKNKEKCIVADEAINMLFKRDFMRGEQKNLLKLMDVCRDHRHLFMFNIPSFWALDSHTIQTRVKLWIHVEKQKYAHFFRPIRNMFAKDVWLRDYNEKLFMKHRKFTRSPNYITSITFESLTPEEYKIYHSIKDSKKIALDDDKTIVDDMTKRDIIQWIKQNNPNADMKSVAEVLKTHYSYVQQVMSGVK